MRRLTETVQPVRRFESLSENGVAGFTTVETSLNNTETNTNFTTVETSLNQTETNASTDAPPSYCDVSKSSEHLPPPYPGT